jgi:hypothetical protein
MNLIRAFIGSVEWRYAWTMPKWPHCYNVLEWNPDKKRGFFELVHAILEHGYREAWPRPPARSFRVVTYFNVDGYRYWVMASEARDVDLINRARLKKKEGD